MNSRNSSFNQIKKELQKVEKLRICQILRELGKPQAAFLRRFLIQKIYRKAASGFLKSKTEEK